MQAAVAQINDLLAVREPDGSVPGPKTCAGALRVYVGPLLEQINDVTSSVDAFVNPSATYQLNRDLAMVARGLTWSAQAATTARAWNRAHGSRAPRATHL